METCHLSIAISPRSPYIMLLRRRLEYAVEQGLVKHWIDQFMDENKELIYDKDIRKEPPQALSISDVRGAFLFLFTGYSFAGISFVIELLYKNHIK